VAQKFFRPLDADGPCRRLPFAKLRQSCRKAFPAEENLICSNANRDAALRPTGDGWFVFVEVRRPKPAGLDETAPSSDFGFRASGFGGLRVTKLNQDLTLAMMGRGERDRGPG